MADLEREDSQNTAGPTAECFAFGDSDSDEEVEEGEEVAGLGNDSKRRLSNMFEHGFDTVNAEMLSVIENITDVLQEDAVNRQQSSVPYAGRRKSVGASKNGSRPSLEMAAGLFGRENSSKPRSSLEIATNKGGGRRASMAKFDDAATSTLIWIQEQLLALQTENSELRAKVHSLEWALQNKETASKSELVPLSESDAEDGETIAEAGRLSVVAEASGDQEGELEPGDDAPKEKNSTSEQPSIKREAGKTSADENAAEDTSNATVKAQVAKEAKSVAMQEHAATKELDPPNPESVAPRSGGFYFDSRYTSDCVQVSANGLQARRIRQPDRDSDNAEEAGCVVFATSPIPSFGDGKYFEVRVDESCSNNPDGLAIGVTNSLLGVLGKPISDATEVPGSWSVGFDGYAKVQDQEEMIETHWHPHRLKVGDLVGLHVSRAGKLTILENGTVAVELASAKVTTGKPLFGFVDLLGNTQAVSIVEGAKPPECLSENLEDGDASKTSNKLFKTQIESQRAQLRAERGHRRQLEEENKELKTRVQKLERTVRRQVELLKGQQAQTKRRDHGSSASSYTSAAMSLWNPNQARASVSHSHQPRGSESLRGNTNMDKWRAAARSKEVDRESSSSQRIRHKESDGSSLATFQQVVTKSMSTFFFGGEKEEDVQSPTWSKLRVHKNIRVGDDAKTASIVGVGRGDSIGFIITELPPRLDDGYGFEICLTGVLGGDGREKDGLAIGFTTSSPTECLNHTPIDATEVPGGVWLAGFDGHFYSAASSSDEGEWTKASRFKPWTLKQGDHVTVQVSFEGRLEIAINVKTCVFATQIPPCKDVPLYGVVELRGGTHEVTLIDEALVNNEDDDD